MGGSDGGFRLPHFYSLLSDLQYDSAFEKCVNDLLNTRDNDESIRHIKIYKY